MCFFLRRSASRPASMAHRIVLLFSLVGLLNGLESRAPSMQECCELGRTKAERAQDCSILLPSFSHICSIVQEHCCWSATEEEACNRGVWMVRARGACEGSFFTGSLWESQISKVCCDCCTLGVKVAAMGPGCELQGLQLGERCSSAAQLCCEDVQESKPTTGAPKYPTGSLEETDPCKNTSCAQLCVGNGRCGCYKGFTLRNDGVNCEDINECQTESHNCTSEQDCVNTEGSFNCRSSCQPGFTLTDSGICKDVDECTLELHDCGANFLCVNTAGSFCCLLRETCGKGYAQDASGSCVDINECEAHASPCQQDQACINTVGSYICHNNTVACPRGYRLSADSSRCEDVDECLIGKKCGSYTCVNLQGTYRCECRPGFTFNAVNKLCQDVNECTLYPGRLCAHKCENTAGSFQCSCFSGFKLAYDGRNCEDIDECESKPCSQECTNVHGSYQCYCHSGYQLSDIDGRTCEDIDECEMPNACSYSCVNTPGGFNCTCPPSGYTLAQDGWTCEDIDECAAGTHTCSVVENCFNVQGGFRCFNFECPPNFLRATKIATGSASEVVRCVKSCQQHDTSCTLDPTHIITSTILSLPTLRVLNQPEEIVFLRTATKISPVPNQPDVYFDFMASKKQECFDVVKSFQNGMIVGVIRQVKPIAGPSELVLKVTMKYVQSGVIIQQNIVIVNVLISEFWF